MNSATNTFFGPLSKDYCSIFLFLSVIGLLNIVLAILGALGLLFSKKGRPELFAGLIYALVIGIVMYLQNRLLYNMCLR